MSFQKLLDSMNREDFVARDQKKQELMNPTAKEIQDIESERIEKKEKLVFPILDEMWVDKSDNVHAMYYHLMNSKREKYKRLLWSNDCYADLKYEAEERAKLWYECFLDFVITNEVDVLSIIK